MSGLTIGTLVGAVLLALIKGIFGTDKPAVTEVVDVPGTPLGPKVAERLRRLARGELK